MWCLYANFKFWVRSSEGTIVAYIFGTAWLAIEAHLTFYQALLAGVIPYIPGDLVKIILVVLVGPIVKKRLQSAGLLL